MINQETLSWFSAFYGLVRDVQVHQPPDYFGHLCFKTRRERCYWKIFQLLWNSFKSCHFLEFLEGDVYKLLVVPQ